MAPNSTQNHARPAALSLADLNLQQAQRVDQWLDQLFESGLELQQQALVFARCRAQQPELAPLVAQLWQKINSQQANHSLDALDLARVQVEQLRISPESGTDASAAETEFNDYFTPGSWLGNWQIEAHVIDGGMSQIYRASRRDGQYQQTVAIKRIRARSDVDPQQFQREKDLLVGLEHPNIARLLDAGLDVSGRAWFAMNWIEGENLDRYLLSNKPELAARITLFLKIAEAVAYAHQRLVLHRDLKPNNVRVDADGEPFLLDFGIGKRMEQVDTAADANVNTRAVFTPEYAAPEQLSARPITVLSDVHGLGLLLFEILTLQRPWHDAGRSLFHAVQAIVNSPAPAPSSMLISSNFAVARIRAQALKGDLDAIVLRCLEKQPEQRYGSVAALCEDLRAWQQGLPVQARARQSGYRSYRLRRWLRRHWVPTTLAAALVLSLLGGLLFSNQQMHIAQAERDQAALEAHRQEAMREHLMLIFREGANRGVQTNAKQLLDASAAQLDSLYRDQPKTRLDVLLAMGELYYTLGDFVAARAMLERLLQTQYAIDSDTFRRATLQLAITLLRLGENESAAIQLQSLAGQIDLQRPSRLSADFLVAQSLLARNRGEMQEGLALQQRAVTLYENASDASAAGRASTLSNLAMAQFQAGDLHAAKQAWQQALRRWQSAGAGSSGDAVATLGNLANTELLLGNLTAAKRYYQRAEKNARSSTSESAAVAGLLGNYARFLMLQGDFAQAKEKLVRALPMSRRYAGADALDVAALLLIRAQLAIEVAAKAEPAQALQDLQQSRVIFAKRLPSQHPLFARVDLLAAKQSLLSSTSSSSTLAALQQMAEAAQRLAQGPALLQRNAVRGEIWLIEAAQIAKQNEIATLAARRLMALPILAQLADWEQAEVRLWLDRAEVDHRSTGAMAAPSSAADWQRIQDILGINHPLLLKLRLTSIAAR